jgi:hypothetical protein
MKKIVSPLRIKIIKNIKIFYNICTIVLDVECRLEDFHEFFCGCRSVPPSGFDDDCTVEFLDDGNLPTASTCGLVLFLPSHEDEKEFTQKMVYGILNSPTFDKV